MEEQEQNSFFTNENLCQSYMSCNLSTDCSKKIIQWKNNSSELQQINNTLKLTLVRYNNDLNDYYQEIESLKKKNSELELKIQKQNIISVGIQTEDQLKYDAQNKTIYNDNDSTMDIKKLELTQQKFNEKTCKLDKNRNSQTPKRKNERLCKQFSSSPCSQNNISYQETPEEEEDINYEYFESKKHLQSMVKQIQKHFKLLQSDIHDSYPSELTKNSIIQTLNNISSQIDYLKIILDDQIIEIEKYSDDLQNKNNEINQENKDIKEIEGFILQSNNSYMNKLNQKICQNPNEISLLSENIQQRQDLSFEVSKNLMNPDNIRKAQLDQEYKEYPYNMIATHQNKETIRMNQQGIFLNTLDGQKNQNDHQNNFEDLLITLDNEEFDLDQNHYKQNSFQQRKKQKDFKQQKEGINKIMTFSFGDPYHELNSSPQTFAKQIKQLNDDQSEINFKKHFINEDENQKKLSTNLQFYLKNQINFINSINKLFDSAELSLDNQTQLDQTKLYEESSQIKLNSLIQEYQQNILQKLTVYEQIKRQLELIQKENNILSMSQNISIQHSENIFGSNEKSFEADQIQNQLISSVKYILNERNLNAHKIKNNMNNLKKIFGKDHEEICIQYESYGVISADLIFIIKYIDNLMVILNQVNIKTFEKIKDYIIEKLSLDIDSLPISKKLKAFIDFIKSSIRQSIFLKYICSI